jgi:hypothetical protein
MRHITFFVYAVLAFDALTDAFVLSRERRISTFLSSTSDFWKQRPGESSTDFYKRIQQASNDPVAFENFVLETRRKERQEKSQSTSPDIDKDKANTDEPKPAYQRAEDWDADQSKRVSGWDEKIQFDGLRHGNGFNQNEILRRHLKGF